jgi:hypothetical protein
MKLNIILILIICFIQVLISKKRTRKNKKQIVIKRRCDRFIDPYDCDDQYYCRWSERLGECVSKHGIMVRRSAIVARPVYGIRRSYISRPSVSVARPYSVGTSYSSRSVSRPTISVSRSVKN